jgi:hypothetical protein
MFWLVGMLAIRIQAGPLELEVHVSRTASLFHAVDQMAHWNPYGHKQYDALKQAGDDEWLQRHAALRKKLGGYGVLDQALYSELGYRQAMKGRLSDEDAAEEGKILDHFAQTLKKFLDDRDPMATAKKLTERRALLEEMAKKAGRFVGAGRVSLPVYLVASPDKGGGGGANGGVLVVEVGEGDCFYTLLHESWHALVLTKQNEVEAAAKNIGMDVTTLGEGMAYAVMPGLYHDGSGDWLAGQVRADEGKPFDDNYVRFRRFALALRPILKQALEDDKQTLSTFLPRALDVYVAVRELETAKECGRSRKIDVTKP